VPTIHFENEQCLLVEEVLKVLLKNITEGFKIVSGNYEGERDSAKLFPLLELHLYGKSDCMNKFGRT
jgi:hypothetical protein